MKNSIAVCGSGSWGTALANHLKKSGHDVCLWGIESDVLKSIEEKQINPKFLVGEKLASGIRTSTDLSKAVANVDAVVIVVPSSVVREVAKKLKPILSGKEIVISTAKGLEDNTQKTMTEVLEGELNSKNVAALSGPSFALEVVRGFPTAVTIAAKNIQIAEKAAALFHHENFRVYTSSDTIGVEFGGAYKNVIAIAAGVVDGANMGHNARAALITRGLSEMQRVISSMGGDAKTASGLSGLGDLLLTATGDLSRNRQVGIGLAKGEKLEDILQRLGQVAEGVVTTPKILELASRHKVELPIAKEVNRLLLGKATVEQSLNALLSRERKKE